MDLEETSKLVDEQAGKSSSPRWKQYAAYIPALAYVLGTTVSAACAQALGGVIPVFELNMWRFLAQFGVAGIAATVCRQRVTTERRQVPWLILSACMSTLFNVCFYTSTLYLPLGTVGGMAPSTTLLLTFLATLFISRKCPLNTIIAVLLCLAGIILTTQPEFIFRDSSGLPEYTPVCDSAEESRATKTNFTTTDETTVNETTEFLVVRVFSNLSHSEKATGSFPREWIGYLNILGQAVGASTTFFICNNQLYDLHPMTFAFWVGFGGTVLSVVPMLIFEDFVLPGTTQCQLLLLGHAVVMGGGVVCGTVGFQLLKPVQNGIIITLEVLLLFVAQCTVMKDINPGIVNPFTIVGAVIIFLGNLFVPISKLWLDLE